MPARSKQLVQLGAALASIRHDNGLTQEELALRSGVHRAYIAELERGRRNPSVETMRKIVKPLRVSLTDWFAKAKI
jgi:transcriptional regulator with XRE-family HTH domain